MKARHWKAEDFHREPWRNGGGTTTELAREGDGERWTWRLSVADIERPGPFSDFSGYERTLMLLEGRGMELHFDDEAPSRRLDRPHQALVFDGGWRADCRLIDGPVRDMNLIVDRRRAKGCLEALWLVHEASLCIAVPRVLVFGLEGTAIVQVDGIEQRVGEGQLLRIDDAIGRVVPARPLGGACGIAYVTIQLR